MSITANPYDSAETSRVMNGRRPNIVLILADDLGYSDLGCFGGEIETPNLDRMAGDGIRMTQFYVNPRCSPTRASLLTGAYPAETGIGVLTTDDRPFGYRGDLSSDVPTIAEQLSDTGYRTGLSGKWHLSTSTRRPTASWPTRRGFHEVFGIIRGATSYYQPRTLVRGERSVEDEIDDGFYLTDALADHAEGFVDRVAEDTRPFFLYFALTAPHWPLHAREEDIAPYREVYRQRQDLIRDARFCRLREMGIVGRETALSPPDEEAASPASRDHAWEAERMAVYAAQVTVMDRAIGRVLEALRRNGVEDNTIVVFLSDNGACEEDLPVSLDGTRVMKEDTCPPITRDGRVVRVGNVPDIIPGDESTFSSYGRSWANVSNTPFRLYKRWLHEGGIAAPFIVRWPSGGLTGGRVEHRLAHVIDVAPTLLAASGLPAQPGRYRGVDLKPGWTGAPSADDALTGDRALYWEHTGNAAIRRGRWKLVREWPADWELYDMETDRAEARDLSREEHRLVRELADQWGEWAEDVGVIEWEAVRAGYAARDGDPERASG